MALHARMIATERRHRSETIRPTCCWGRKPAVIDADGHWRRSCHPARPDAAVRTGAFIMRDLLHPPRRPGGIVLITGILVGLIGLALAVLGGWLLYLGVRHIILSPDCCLC
ncbi:hypothetical protein ACFQ4K_02115 [Tistrella bauzanensis]